MTKPSINKEIYLTSALKSALIYRSKSLSPKKDSGLKFFVAATSSRKVNVSAATLIPSPSLGPGNSFLKPALFLIRVYQLLQIPSQQRNADP